MMKSKIIKNTIMLYLFNAERILFPLLLLPILTRRLSTDYYALYVFVGAFIAYLRLFVDFGFDLSGTRDIVKANTNEEIGRILLDITSLRIILWFVGTMFLLIISNVMSNEILKSNLFFLLLSSLEILFEVFYFDYYYRGIEKMEYITFRFFVTKIISLILIFTLVKDDAYVILIPILNGVANFIGALLVCYQIKFISHIRNRKFCLLNIIARFFDSLKFFLTKIISTVFTASNTIVLGCLADSYDVVIWSLAINIIAAVQSLYNPISNALFPSMVKKFDKEIIKKAILIGMSIVLLVNIILWNFSDIFLSFFAGEKYVISSRVLSILLWMLFFSVGIGIFGWPVLGALGGEKYMLYSTIIGAIWHICGVVILYLNNICTAYSIAWLRVFSEGVLFISIAIFVTIILYSKIKAEDITWK